ncbi:MAG: tetratricopeptide repeat protein [Candidatus Rokubacteria bacterium]|nr:tetratricopeptide repeat protein [Candidatus Rokubacteria bacterium]
MLSRLLWPAGIALAACLPFLPSLQGQFLYWDDVTNFLMNEGYRGLGWLQLRYMFTTTLLGHWIPLTWLTLGINYALGGMNPWGYHLGNLLLHSANAVCLYFIARRLLASASGETPARVIESMPDRAGAAFAALVFAVHPLRVESVAWITERRDVLSGLFFLLSILFYLRATDGGGFISGRWRTASLLAFAAAFLSKSIVMALPGVLLLLDVYPLRRLRLDWRALLLEKLPYAAIAVVGAVVAMLALRIGASASAWSQTGMGARVGVVAYAFWFYPSRWVWPVALSPLYELPPRVDLSQGRFLGPLLALLAVTACLVLLRRRAPWALAAWAYSALVLLPVSGIVPAGFQLAHDRYSYLSGLGFAVVAGGALWTLLRAGGADRLGRAPATLALAVAVVVVLGLGAASWGQTRIWRDSDSLWERAVALDADCVVCANNLAAAIVRRREPSPAMIDRAEGLVRHAIELRADHFTSYDTLGAILTNRGRTAQAEEAFRQALSLAPNQAAPAANLGALLARQGRYAEAVPWLRKAAAAQPAFPGLRSNLGYALRNHGIELARQGRLDEAVSLLAEASRILTQDPDTHRNLGQALMERGRGAEAVPVLERALALDGASEATRFLLTQARLQAGRPTPR